MEIKYPRFSWRLLRNFLLSTAIPIALFTFLLAHSYQKEYNADVSTLVSTTLDTTARNLHTYLAELEQVSLMPYYEESFFSILGRIRQKGGVPNTLDRMDLERSIGNPLSFSQYTRDDIVDTLIANENGDLFYTTSLINCSLDTDYAFEQSDWYQAAIEKQGKAVFFPSSSMEYLVPENDNFQNPKVLSVVRSIVNLKTRQPLCVIKIDANMAAFDKMFQEITWHVPSIVAVTDAENRLVYCNSPENAESLINLQTAAQTIKYNNNSYYLYHKQEDSSQWNVYVLLDKNSIDQKSNYIYAVAFSLYLLGLLCATFLYYFHSRKMVNSVNTIHDMANEIRSGNYTGKYQFAKNNELQLVIDSVTYIASLLREKIKEEYQLRLQQKELQLKALQSQINPHFLFNTLNGLIALNQLDKRNELERSLYALTHMLRYTLAKTTDSTLEQEMRFLNDYCLLQKLRFGQRLNYSINYPPSAAQFPIPRLILQPLVENAVIHGIEPSQHAGFLAIDVLEYRENELLITIEDDGIGFQTENTSEHIGIDNVRQRILLLNPRNTFSIESIPGNGTIITITLKAGNSHENSNC